MELIVGTAAFVFFFTLAWYWVLDKFQVIFQDGLIDKHSQLSWIEHPPSKRTVTGSNPVGCTITEDKMENSNEIKKIEELEEENDFLYSILAIIVFVVSILMISSISGKVENYIENY